MSEFFHMGGHGGYIWPAYGLSVLDICGLALSIHMRRRALQKRLDALSKQEHEQD